MSPINEYFDNVICINLARRQDRWRDSVEQALNHNLKMERFDAIDIPTQGNNGCTESHGAVLEMIIQNGWNRTLILEDDFQFRFNDSQEQFERMVKEVPEDWWMLYLGGHYAENPIARVSPHVIRMGRMWTTSSYGITLEAAQEMRPFIHGIGPIDTLYCKWHIEKPCYIFQPRLIFQRTSYSDLMEKEMMNEWCMTDTSHESTV